MPQMRKALLTAGVALAAMHGALAQEASTKFQDRVTPPAKRIVNASVDADGRIVPASDIEGGPVQRVGAGSPGSATPGTATVGKPRDPCPSAKPLSQEEGMRIVETVAREQGFAPGLVRAVAKQESRFVSNALSPKGAYGLMQLLPATATSYGVDICDPADNVKGGIAFLRDLNRKYPNPLYMLAAYNAGEVAVLKYKGVPPYTETVGYVATVLNDFYQWPSVGSEPVMPAGAVKLGPSDVQPTATSAADQNSDPVTRINSRTAGKAKRAQASAPVWQGGMVQNFD